MELGKSLLFAWSDNFHMIIQQENFTLLLDCLVLDLHVAADNPL